MEESNKIDNSIELKSLEHYKFIANKYKEQTKEIYDKHFRFSDVIGKCIGSYKEWVATTKDDSLESFFNYYISNVKSVDAFKTASAILHYFTNLPKEDMLDLLICHAIIETYFGGQIENFVTDFLKRQDGVKIINLDKNIKEKFDRTYGIDIIFKFEEKIYLVQVKPISFFLGKGKTIVFDRKDAFNRIKKFKEIYTEYKDAVLKFCVYDGDFLISKDTKSFLTVKNSIFLDLDEKYFSESTGAFWHDFCRNKEENFKQIKNG